MEVKIRDIKGIQVVNFSGKLDTTTSVQAQKELDMLVSSGEKKLLVNFETLDYISSAGLRILLATAKKLKGVGGELRISNLNEVVNEVFEISGFTTIFNVFPTESEALEEF